MPTTAVDFSGESHITKLIQDAMTDKENAQRLALDASKLLEVTQNRFDSYKDSGFFKRCWYGISGKSDELSRATQYDLIEMQSYALHYLQALQKQNLLHAESVAVIRNNLDSLVTAEEETRNIVFGLMNKFDDRISAQEQSVAIHDWLVTVAVSGYLDLPPHHRLLKVAFDFYDILQKHQIPYTRIQGLIHVRQALHTLKIGQTEDISITDFLISLFKELLADGPIDSMVYPELVQLQIGEDIVSSKFVIENIPGCAYNALYLVKDRFKFIQELYSVYGDNGKENFWEIILKLLNKVLPNPVACYSPIDLIEEIIAGNFLTEKTYRDHFFQKAQDYECISMEDQITKEMEADSRVNPIALNETPDYSSVVPITATNSELNASDDVAHRVALAKSLELSPELQYTLMNENDEAVLLALASNQSLLPAYQLTLAEISSPTVRENLAGNISLSTNAQNLLLITATDQIKIALAKNHAIDIATQELLANDKSTDLNVCLAANTSLVESIQKTLITKGRESWYSSQFSGILFTICSNTALTESSISQIISFDIENIIAELAENPALPNKLIIELAADSRQKVRAGVAKNRNLPEYLQQKFLEDSNSNVINGLAENPSLTDSVQVKLYNKLLDSKFQTALPWASLFHRGFDSNGKYADLKAIEQKLARNPALKIVLQQNLADHENIYVRLSLFLNENIDDRVKIRLVKTFKENERIEIQQQLNFKKTKLESIQNACNESWKKYRDYDTSGFFSTEARGAELRNISNSNIYIKEQCSLDLSFYKGALETIDKILNIS